VVKKPVEAQTFVLFNKPFNVLSQFTDSEGAAPNLKDYILFEKYLCQRGGSIEIVEGLLVLNGMEGKLQHQLASPCLSLKPAKIIGH